MAYVAGRDLDGEFEIYEPPTATGQYPTHLTAPEAARVLRVGGASRETWGVYELREVDA